MSCRICPRNCNVDRTVTAGYCGVTSKCPVARISLHPYEEPCISGTNGSGTIFFSGCNLKCIFCQNMAIRDGKIGTPHTVQQLSEAMLHLQSEGAHNINLVTPTPHLDTVIPAIRNAKANGLHIPIVYNTGAYETAETISRLDGLVDVYLPDLKFCHPELSRHYANAVDYFPVAMEAIDRMLAQTGHLRLSDDGLAKRGVMIRHLVLPNCVFDTRAILDAVAARFSRRCYLSVMRQYTPPNDSMPAPLNRRITQREYRSALDHMRLLGFENVYIQEPGAAGLRYTPKFTPDAAINSQGYMS